RQYTTPRTNERAGCTPTTPSALSPCAPSKALAAAPPAATARTRSTAAPCASTPAQSETTVVGRFHPSSGAADAADDPLALAAPAKCSCTSPLVVHCLPAFCSSVLGVGPDYS